MHSKQWKLHRAVLCLLVATVVGMVLGEVARAETAAALAVQDTPHASPGQPAGQEPEAESTEHEAGHADPFAIILINTSRTKKHLFSAHRTSYNYSRAIFAPGPCLSRSSTSAIVIGILTRTLSTTRAARPEPKRSASVRVES